MITTGRTVNFLLGHGDSSKFNLLGGSNGNAGDIVLLTGGLGFLRGKASIANKVLLGGSGGYSYPRPPGPGKGAGCVHVDSWLPGGIRAGEIRVGDVLQLADPSNGMVPAAGEVTYSETKEQPGYRIVTAGGVSLVCSLSAPIPVARGGYRHPAELMGHDVPAMVGADVGWAVVVDIQFLGMIPVQHITVGDRCFWAGEHAGRFLLHHNAKDPGSGGSEGSTGTTGGGTFLRDRSGRRGDL